MCSYYPSQSQLLTHSLLLLLPVLPKPDSHLTFTAYFRESFLYSSISLINEKSQTCPKLLFTCFDSLNQWSNETKTLLSFSHAKWYSSFASLYTSCLPSCKGELNVKWTFVSQTFQWQSQHNCHINPTRYTQIQVTINSLMCYNPALAYFFSKHIHTLGTLLHHPTLTPSLKIPSQPPFSPKESTN